MLPSRLSAADPESERARYKIVRRDTFTDVPGLILGASVETGECIMRGTDNAAKPYSFGPGGLSIVVATRR